MVPCDGLRFVNFRETGVVMLIYLDGALTELQARRSADGRPFTKDDLRGRDHAEAKYGHECCPANGLRQAASPAKREFEATHRLQVRGSATFQRL
jgi:hypothetical protein